MGRFLRLLLPLLLLAGVAFGGARDNRKLLEGTDLRVSTNEQAALNKVLNGWLIVDLELSSGVSFKSVVYKPSGVVWIAGSTTVPPRDLVWR